MASTATASPTIASATTWQADLGPLAPLLADVAVTDILVNGVGAVWLDRGQGLEKVLDRFGDEAMLRRLAVRLASAAGKRLDDAAPYVDGLLPGGIRLHALLPPLVEGGAHVSLRVPRRVVPGLTDLRRWGMVDDYLVRVLQRMVESRAAFVIGGGTGSGKTTLLGALLSLAGPGERLVIVEDTRELRVDHPHVVYLAGRSANVEGRGGISLTTLVQQSLRMRPDRLVLGEVRGAEVRELLTAMNTGHEGGCGTLHANSTGDFVSRFQALGALADMSPAAVDAQLASALDVAVHVSRGVGGQRMVAEVAVFTNDRHGVRTQAALSRGAAGWVAGPGLKQFLARVPGASPPPGSGLTRGVAS
ncbi:TadA family conjugal transfer-associated ATPase [Ornithinimicrobium sp. Arc0846-15]|nr:TadA family conjugal transfer-associated ATPase [Ornithinimicrobium laminariae]